MAAGDPRRGGKGGAQSGRGGGSARGPEGPPERGIPDSLLIGVIGFLVGMTLLMWSATGLAGLLAKGAWPDNVTFVRTPKALRSLISEPHDLAAAWPETPAEQLSGYGLFWGLFIGQLMILFVLTVFAIGTTARYRIVRARRRQEATDRRAAAEDVSVPAAPDGSAPAYERTSAPYDRLPARYENAAPDERAASHGRADTGPGTRSVPGQGAVDGAAPPLGGAPPSRPVPAAAAIGAPSQPADGSPTASEGPSAPYGDKAETAAQAPAHAPQAADQQPPYASGTPVAPSMEVSAAPGTPVAAPRAALFPSPEPSLPRVLYGPQRGDAAVRTVLDAEGPVLVVTSDPEVWSATKDARAKLGAVHVFDPAHLLDTPARLRWNPAAGCEVRDVAAARAAALLAPVRPAHALDRPTADAAETLLRCWLHAAAVDGRPFRQVHRWAQGGSAHEPVRILRTHPKALGGVAGELEATLTAHPERRDVALELTARALSALSSIHIRDACNPGRADALALESFIAEGGTLYLVGESIEDPRTHPGAMPLLTALASSVVEHGRRMAERSSSGRLDPPVTLVLDDVAAVAPIPALPDLIAQGAAQGLLTLALMRSQEQARARWPHRALVR
ncbi:hypothetical protein ACQUSR_17890 [Streptomyces sp. P1-3]|uniref:type IV secretory system conjugative DNA transfer family protein n=1 Tax=Streptomyces sp. P1-3 TaxID=3421658 RepID=UPI003D36FE7B